MKKFFMIILVAMFVFCAASCGDVQSTTATTATKKPTYWGSSVNYDGVIPDLEYKTFEEYCESVTVVVKAKMTEMRGAPNDCFRFVFKVNEVLVGEAEETINVIVYDKLQSVRTPDGVFDFICESGPDLNVDDEYLLMLMKTEDETSEFNPYYSWKYATVINLDFLEKSEMYCQSLAPHIKGIDMNTCTKEELTEYVCNLIENK